MGFFYQVGLLLWKNLKLKTRSPFVFLFELCIPLALFFVLLWIRRLNQPNHYWSDMYSAMPLPSAGVVSILQLFCNNRPYKQDQYGFKYFMNSRISEFLTQFKSISENNNFFVPGFASQEMESLPRIYKTIIDNPASIRDHLLKAKDFELSTIINNQSEFLSILTHNMSMTPTEARAILHSRVNIHEIYETLFGVHHNGSSRGTRERDRHKRVRRSLLITDELITRVKNYGLESLQNIVLGHLDEIGDALLLKVLSEKTLMNDTMAEKIITQLLGIMEFDRRVEPWQVAEVLKSVLLSPVLLHGLVCLDTGIPQILSPQAPYNMTILLAARAMFCNLTKGQLEETHAEMLNLADNKSIANALLLDEFNLTALTGKIHAFRQDVGTFYRFQSSLIELGNFTQSLPQDSCPPLPAPVNTTQTPNVTDTEEETTPPPVTHKTEPKDKGNKFAGFLKIWYTMQKTICGSDVKIPEKKLNKIRSQDDLKGLDLGELGISETQEQNLGILLHVLYHNPRILYAPNNTAANRIIKMANSSFAMVDEISDYAQNWLNISADIRAYLESNRTARNLQLIQQVHQNIQGHPYLEALLQFDDDTRKFVTSPVPDIGFFLDQLNTIDNAACSWRNLMSGISLDIFKGFKTEEELVQYALKQASSDDVSIIGSVVFEDFANVEDDRLPPHIRYKIRQNASFTMDTKLVRSRMYYPGPGPTPKKYYKFGFVWIQDVIERAIINVQTGREVGEPGLFVHQFPYPCFTPDMFLYLIQHVMPLCLTISWVYSVAMLVQGIVYEKEQRLKEIMRMMGLNNAVHWCAWFITSFVQMSITMAALTAVLHYGKVLQYSNPVIIFITLEIFAVATIWFSFLISVLYSKAKVAAAWAGIIYFLMYVPYMYISIREGMAGAKITAVEKTLASLSSTTAFGLGAKYMAYYEQQEIGVQWDNINTSPVEQDSFNISYVMMLMIMDALIYGILVWYIEHVYPGTYGLPKPFYFFLTKSYWCGASKADSGWMFEILEWIKRRSGYLSVTEEDQACAMEPHLIGLRGFEADSGELPAGISIRNLTKVYKKGQRKAVNNLSLDLYEDQITSFLGHNGAGKTTTMSILTGLLPPTSGYAVIYGNDIRTSMDVIRKDLGMCPQHSILFDKLTVEEHLWFYSKLKGVKSRDITTSIERMIKDIDLPRKRHTKVDCLSGGMQRKLSVAIAFVGGSRTIVLDEPTAGVDPYARRAIWDLLVKYKEGRTILLTTHHMDEAEILSDRIAIISNGRVECCGSSVFLKNMFGEGYHLTAAKTLLTGIVPSRPTNTENNPDPAVDIFTQDPPSQCEEVKVTRFIRKHMSSAYLKSETSRELHYILPFEEAKKGRFEKLFAALETNITSLDISSFGVMDTTLEEVFMTITEQRKHDDSNSSEMSNLSIADKLSHETTDNIIDSQQNNNALHNDQSNSTLHNAPNRGDQSNSTLHNAPNRGDQSQQQELEMGDFAAHKNTDSDSDSDLSMNMGDSNVVHSGDYFLLENRVDDTDNVIVDNDVFDGCGSYRVTGYRHKVNQFRAIMIKRFYYISRNRKSLFSQIILPALFVSVAMTVALSAPGFDDSPPIELTPSQYFNYTLPVGNFIPFSDESVHNGIKISSIDATPQELIQTLHLASGIGATCVLNSPFNSSFDLTLLKRLNYTLSNYELLSKYFEPGCEKVFVHGLPLENFVPPVLKLEKNKRVDENGTLVEVDEPREKVVNSEIYPKCECAKDHSAFRCDYAQDQKKPPHIKVVTSDILQDITGAVIKDYFLHTTDFYRLHRYGAITFGLQQNSVPKEFGLTNRTLLRRMGVPNVAMVWYNHKGYHSMPTYINAINNAILRANLPKNKGNPAAYGITAINHPMNETANEPSMDAIIQGSEVLIAIFVIVAMSFVPASFVLFLVYERSINSKHLQFVSGLDPIVYWIGNYFWDMCNYLIPSTCCIVILIIFHIPAYTSPENLPVVVALFLLYGWSITPMMYPASFVFKEPSFAYTFLIVINLFVGITCIVCSFLLEIFANRNKTITNVHEFLKNAFLIFPNYCLGRGLMDLSFNYYKNMFFMKTGKDELMKSAMDWEIAGRSLVAMATMGGLFIIITLLCEYNFFVTFLLRYRKRSWTPLTRANEDQDVAAERRRILHGNGRGDLVRLVNLTKIYKTCKLGQQLAVDRLCVGVPAGECFGLLGVNGAGKTTTFKMLTGDITPTGGSAYINRCSIDADIHDVHRNIGYCPQFDALYDELTAREHLQLYARLRGVPRKDEKRVVDWALSKLCLEQYADKQSVTYSGGNKRKLSTAIALVGKPSVLFMDEPTTGMDPNSRRFIWELIQNLVKEGRSIVFTSHSMEECEALCTRLAIMVNGQFRCLGSTQHLKHKFGDGYKVSMRLVGPDFDRSKQQTRRFMERHFPEAELRDHHYNTVQYHLPSASLSLSHVFSCLEQAQNDIPIADYSVSQNTLDSIFVNFVKEQVEVNEQRSMYEPRNSMSSDAFPFMLDDTILTNDSDDDELLSGYDGNQLSFINLESLNAS